MRAAAGRHHRSHGRLPIVHIAIALCLIAAVIGIRLRTGHPGTSPATERTWAAASTPAPILGATPTTSGTLVRFVTPPIHLAIPSIGVNSGLQALKRLANGSLQPPTHWNVPGWYAGGVLPGAVGPAVIAGHIDSTTGPAVFYRLQTLRVGARISITEQNGTVLSFLVDRAETFPKDHFPTELVYGPTPNPQLRLISCTGEFDRTARNYLSNLVVSAHLET